MATRMMDKIDQAVLRTNGVPFIADVKRVWSREGVVTGFARAGNEKIKVRHVNRGLWQEVGYAGEEYL